LPSGNFSAIWKLPALWLATETRDPGRDDMKESNMPKDDPAKKTTDEQAAEMRAWGSMERVVGDALTALAAGDPKQVSEYLESIRGVAAKKARHTRTWRGMVRLAEDTISAVNAGNEKMIHEYLVAIQAVTQCAQEA